LKLASLEYVKTLFVRCLGDSAHSAAWGS